VTGLRVALAPSFTPGQSEIHFAPANPPSPTPMPADLLTASIRRTGSAIPTKPMSPRPWFAPWPPQGRPTRPPWGLRVLVSTDQPARRPTPNPPANRPGCPVDYFKRPPPDDRIFKSGAHQRRTSAVGRRSRKSPKRGPPRRRGTFKAPPRRPEILRGPMESTGLVQCSSRPTTCGKILSRANWARLRSSREPNGGPPVPARANRIQSNGPPQSRALSAESPRDPPAPLSVAHVPPVPSIKKVEGPIGSTGAVPRPRPLACGPSLFHCPPPPILKAFAPSVPALVPPRSPM